MIQKGTLPLTFLVPNCVRWSMEMYVCSGNVELPSRLDLTGTHVIFNSSQMNWCYWVITGMLLKPDSLWR